MKCLIFTILIVTCFAGCSATTLSPGAQRIRITTKEPSSKCQYLGDAVGEQGGSFTGKFTSNKNLEIGARNDLKNQALAMGGNVVHLITDRAGDTGSNHSSGQTNVIYSGAIYKCPVEK